MARKLPRLQRVLDAPALASVAYGEVASSLYFALGIVALHALGLTPAVLAVVGVIFLVVTLSYAEGTTSIGETGGAATFVRVAFNDFAGFLTGWALFLDYLIVIALSALFLPHYLGLAIGMHSIAQRPGDVIVGCCVIVGIALVRLLLRTRLYSFSLTVPFLDLVTQLLLVLLGFAFLFSPSALTRGLSLGTQPSWHQVAFALPLAFLAYTGLETVANFAEETRQPGRDLPRSLFTGIGAVVLVTVLIGLVGLSAYPATNGTTELGTTWLRAPLMGIVFALGPHVAFWVEHALRVYVGLTGAFVLLAAAATSNSGFGRLAYSLAQHGQLPRGFGRLSRRSLHSPEAVISAAAISIVLLVSTDFTTNPVSFLASLFSFGVLLAFTAAQLAVVRLRFTKPQLERPFRVPLSIRFRGADVPLPSVLGALATTAIFVAAMVTHIGARYGGPIWLAAGGVVYLLVRRSRGTGLLEHVEPAAEGALPQAEFSKILVPVKLGDIGEEMVATAVKLAQERDAKVVAVHVIRVPLDLPLDAELADEEERSAASLAEAAVLGEDLGVKVEGRSVRARSIGEAIVQATEETGADLIVLGSSPRWRRQSRFFSPTVDYVLRNAPAEVLVVAFPQGVLEEV
ncbi:MAG TPA: universal stress protein [Gaiellaceae bacterium]|jgi:APA family basic amino acid/polyamine antiporter|nr:universal stress protein [Gaiellaceae bacterium]